MDLFLAFLPWIAIGLIIYLPLLLLVRSLIRWLDRH